MTASVSGLRWQHEMQDIRWIGRENQLERVGSGGQEREVSRKTSGRRAVTITEVPEASVRNPARDKVMRKEADIRKACSDFRDPSGNS